MTKITPYIWIGNSHDAENVNVSDDGIDAILNVAVDLQISRGWNDGIAYHQCGLVDGPGNELSLYYAAILQLAALRAMGRTTLLCCHNGESRSVAVLIMYLHLAERREGFGWVRKIISEKRYDWIRTVISEKRYLPESAPHKAHKQAFEKIDWKLLEKILEPLV